METVWVVTAQGQEAARISWAMLVNILQGTGPPHSGEWSCPKHPEVERPELRDMKRCLVMLIIREMHVKTTMRCPLAPARMVIIRENTSSKRW